MNICGTAMWRTKTFCANGALWRTRFRRLAFGLGELGPTLTSKQFRNRQLSKRRGWLTALRLGNVPSVPEFLNRDYRGREASGPPLRTLQEWDGSTGVERLGKRQEFTVFAFGNPTLAQNARVGHPPELPRRLRQLVRSATRGRETGPDRRV